MKPRVLITGASAGAGRAMAKRFAAAGHDLIIAARREDQLLAVKAEVEASSGTNVTIVACDLTQRADLERLYQIAGDLGTQVMINNAGLGDWNFTWEVATDKLEAMIDLNARALALLSTWFVRDNLDKPATLINVTSLAGYSIFGAAVPYSATKFFATAFTEGLILDLATVRSPLRAKVMTPGPIDTEFTAISLADTRLQGLDTGGVRFHTPAQIADFTYQLFESEKAVGIVDLASMEFVLRDTIHPSGSL